MRKAVKRTLIVIVVLAAATLLLWPWAQRIRYPLYFASDIMETAEDFELDPALVAAVILCESHFDPEAVSRAGAVGLMQIMPDTALWLCEKEGWPSVGEEELKQPGINIDLGCSMLGRMINEYRHLDTALAAYNAGPGHVDEWLQDARYSQDGQTLTDIPFPETRSYVRKVRSAYEKYKDLYDWSSS